MRTPSNIVVFGFDPMKDPSVPEMLKAEQVKNPEVERIYCHGAWGMVETPKGVFCLTTEGVGPSKPINETGVVVDFYREYKPNDKGLRAFEPVPFARATYSLKDVIACATGVHKRLDEFVDTFGARKESNYTEWERALTEASK